MSIRPSYRLPRPHTRAYVYAHARRLNQFSLANVPASDFDEEFYHHPTTYLRRTLGRFRALVSDAVHSCRLRTSDAAILTKLLSQHHMPDRLTLASIRVRREGYRLLRNILLRMWGSPDPTVRRRWYFVTLIGDVGNALEYQPVVEFARAKQAFRSALAATGLHAMGFIEVQAGTNFPQAGAGRTLMFHAHAIGFTEDDAFDASEVQTRLNRELPLSNWLGARTIEIAEIDQPGGLGRKAAYLFKGPSDGKYVERNPRTASGLSFKRAVVRPSMALRLFEALTLLDYPTATWSVGRGNEIKTPWLQELRAWHQGRGRPHRRSNVGTTALWQRVWTAPYWRTAHQPIDVRWDTRLPPSTAFAEAIARYLQRLSR